MESVDASMRQVILDDLGTTEEDIKKNLKELKHWLHQQPHLPHFSDDSLLMAFLCGSKSLSNAKQKLNNFFTSRTKFPQFFADRDTAKVDWGKSIELAYLPGLTPGGLKVLMSKVPANCSNFDLVETLKVNMFLSELMMFKENPLISGHFSIVDASNLSVEFLGKLSAVAMSRVTRVYLNAYPLRIAGVVLFNSPAICDIMVNMFLKPFLPSKLKERVHVIREDHTALEKYIPLEMLPNDYAPGQAPSLAELTEESQKKIREAREWFLKEGSATCQGTVNGVRESFCNVM